MTPGARSERGDTLVEILAALVIIGLIVSAYFAAYATASTGSKGQRDLVTADGVLRDYAEAIKSAVRDQVNGCGKSNPTTFTASYTPPAGFTVSSSPSVTGQTCPAVTAVNLEHLTVQLPTAQARVLDIEVRTP